MTEKKKQITVDKAAKNGDNHGIKPAKSDNWKNLSKFVDNKEELREKQRSLEEGHVIRLELEDNTDYYRDIEILGKKEEGKEQEENNSFQKAEETKEKTQNDRATNIRKQVALKSAVEFYKNREIQGSQEVLDMAGKFERWLKK